MPSASSFPKKWFYQGLGALAVVLALLGIALPLLPTTPFLLVAAWCFAKSSPKWHQWLLKHPLLGSFIRNWEEKRCVTRGVKRFAMLSLLLFGGYAVVFAFDHWGAKAFGAALIGTSFVILWRLDICQET